MSGGRMEELYLQTVAKHTAGKQGKRGCDAIAKMFADLVLAMEQDTRDQMKDILGDLFEGAVTYGESGQYMTPMPICELMARLTIYEQSPVDTTEPGHHPRRVHDPCSGSGRMLLAAAQINRHWEFVGQDIDSRCVRMTALNLAFRNLYGYVIHGNTLALQQKLIYRTGFDGVGFLREIQLATCPALVQQQIAMVNEPVTDQHLPSITDEPPVPKHQLRLF